MNLNDILEGIFDQTSSSVTGAAVLHALGKLMKDGDLGAIYSDIIEPKSIQMITKGQSTSKIPYKKWGVYALRDGKGNIRFTMFYRGNKDNGNRYMLAYKKGIPPYLIIDKNLLNDRHDIITSLVRYEGSPLAIWSKKDGDQLAIAMQNKYEIHE